MSVAFVRRLHDPAESEGRKPRHSVTGRQQEMRAAQAMAEMALTRRHLPGSSSEGVLAAETQWQSAVARRLEENKEQQEVEQALNQNAVVWRAMPSVVLEVVPV